MAARDILSADLAPSNPDTTKSWFEIAKPYILGGRRGLGWGRECGVFGLVWLALGWLVGWLSGWIVCLFVFEWLGRIK